MTADPSPVDEAPVLVACSHGTAAPAGRRALEKLRAGIAALRPGLEVAQAYVDVQPPRVADVVRDLTARRRRCVVVPLLLSAGYHVRVDVAGAVAGSGLAVAAAALGPDPVLVDVLVDRLAEAGARSRDAVVLAATGSSDRRARADVERVAADLAARRGCPVQACYLSGPQPGVAAAVSAAVSTPGRAGVVCVATYTLAPGVLSDRIGEQALAAGASRVSLPLSGHPALTQLALRRYDDALPLL